MRQVGLHGGLRGGDRGTGGERSRHRNGPQRRPDRLEHRRHRSSSRSVAARGEKTTLPAHDGATEKGVEAQGEGAASRGEDVTKDRPDAHGLVPPGEPHVREHGKRGGNVIEPYVEIEVWRQFLADYGQDQWHRLAFPFSHP